MGLDSVELVMAVEEDFDITLSDAEASQCRTPGDLIEVVCRLVGQVEHPTCRSQRAFHRLRKALGSVLGIPRDEVRLDSRLDALLPDRDRRERWDQLRTELGGRTWGPRRWPALGRPGWILGLNYTLALGAGAAGVHLEGLTSGCLLAGTAGYLTTRLTRPTATLVPAGHPTIRSLIPCVPASRRRNWTRDEIAGHIRELVIEQLALEPDIYREDADFVRDLGMD